MNIAHDLVVSSQAKTYMSNWHYFYFIYVWSWPVITGCGDGLARCFDAKSGALRRSFKGHDATINALQVSVLTISIWNECDGTVWLELLC